MSFSVTASLSLPFILSAAETLAFLDAPRLASLVAPKDVHSMTRRDDIKLSHGVTAKAQENAVKQNLVRSWARPGVAVPLLFRLAKVRLPAATACRVGMDLDSKWI